MYLKCFNVRPCFLTSDMIQLTASNLLCFIGLVTWDHHRLALVMSGAWWQQSWAWWATANLTMQTRTGHDKPWHRPCINGGQDTTTWNWRTGVLWSHHGLIRLVAITNIWLEIWSVVETKGWDMSRCVPDTAAAELSCCPSPAPRLAGASIMLLLAPLSCHGRNSKVKKQKGLWHSQPSPCYTGSKIVPERL